MTKTVIVKNTTSFSNEEYIIVATNLPLIRILKSRIIDVVGIRETDPETQCLSIRKTTDVCMVLKKTHPLHTDLLITLSMFDVFLMRDRVLEPIPTTHLGECYFSEINRIIQDKDINADLFIFAASNWTDFTDDTIKDHYQQLWDETDLEVAQIELINNEDFFSDLDQPLLNNVWVTRATEAENFIHIDFDAPEEMTFDEVAAVIQFIQKDLMAYCNKQFLDIHHFSLGQKVFIDLTKTEQQTEVFLYYLLTQEVDDVIYNSVNCWTRDIEINVAATWSILAKELDLFFKRWQDSVQTMKAK